MPPRQHPSALHKRHQAEVNAPPPASAYDTISKWADQTITETAVLKYDPTKIKLAFK